MVDLLIPTGVRQPIGHGQEVALSILPEHLQNKVVAFRNSKEAADLLAQIFGGRAAKPRQEVIMIGPDGRTPIMVAGMGQSEVSEIEDILAAAYEKGQERLKKLRTVIPFAEYRERRGLPQADQFDQKFREAIQAKLDEQRRNMRSNPPPDIRSKFVKGQSQVSMPAQPWKEEKN